MLAIDGKFYSNIEQLKAFDTRLEEDGSLTLIRTFKVDDRVDRERAARGPGLVRYSVHTTSISWNVPPGRACNCGGVMVMWSPDLVHAEPRLETREEKCEVRVREHDGAYLVTPSKVVRIRGDGRVDVVHRGVIGTSEIVQVGSLFYMIVDGVLVETSWKRATPYRHPLMEGAKLLTDGKILYVACGTTLYSWGNALYHVADLPRGRVGVWEGGVYCVDGSVIRTFLFETRKWISCEIVGLRGQDAVVVYSAGDEPRVAALKYSPIIDVRFRYSVMADFTVWAFRDGLWFKAWETVVDIPKHTTGLPLRAKVLNDGSTIFGGPATFVIAADGRPHYLRQKGLLVM
jgi:hypothetical protein